MLEIKNLEEWTKEYFSNPENIKQSEKACERYDRLMVKNIRRQMMSGIEQINILGDVDDPGKVLEKAKYQDIPTVIVDGVKGKLRINMVDRDCEFIPE